MKRWTPNDHIILRHIYATHTSRECAAILDRTEEAVETRASKLGLRKTKRALAAIRKRAQERNPACYLMQIAPAKPTEKPQDRMAGVVYGRPTQAPGKALNGGMMARHMAHVA